MLLLRIRDNNADRVDVEGHREAICKLIPRETDDRKGISYLNWFQAIALADAGASDAAKKKALFQLDDDIEQFASARLLVQLSRSSAISERGF